MIAIFQVLVQALSNCVNYVQTVIRCCMLKNIDENIFTLRNNLHM